MRHVEWTGALLQAFDLRDVVLFGQDRGGLIFFVHVGRDPDRFAGVVAANTALPDPDIRVEDVPPEAVAPFLSWVEWSQEREELRPSEVVGGDSPLNQTRHALSDGERAAYDAPFPDESYRAGARQFPLIVPLDDTDPPASMLRAAWAGFERYDRPFVTAFADQEDVTGSSSRSSKRASRAPRAGPTRRSRTPATSFKSTHRTSSSRSSLGSRARSTAFRSRGGRASCHAVRRQELRRGLLRVYGGDLDGLATDDEP